MSWFGGWFGGGDGGACDYPAESDVRDGIAYGGGTGNLTLPAYFDVRLGVQYGAEGDEFTGTLNVGGPLLGDLSYLLAHSPAHILAQALIATGLVHQPVPGTLLEWGMFVSSEPAKPDNVVTAYDTAGRGHGRSQIDGERQQHFGVQVRVRSTEHTIGYAKAQAIAIAMDQQIYHASIAIGAYRYLIAAISRTTDVISLGKEPTSENRLFTINAVMAVRVQV